MMPSNNRRTARLARTVAMLVVLAALIRPAVGPAAIGSAEARAAERGLTALWTFDAGDAITEDPIIADGVVYVQSNDDVIHAVDAATGEQLWHVPSAVTGSFQAVIGEGLLFTLSVDEATGKGSLIAVDLASEGNDVRWTAEFDGVPTGRPTVTADGLVLVSVYQEDADSVPLVALDINDGSERWRFSTFSTKREDGTKESRPMSTSWITTANGTIWFAADRFVVALDAANGTVRWTSADAGYPLGRLLYSDGALYGIGDYGTVVFARDPDTGDELWSETLADRESQLYLEAVDAGAMYLGNTSDPDNDAVAVFDLAKRAERWSLDNVPGLLTRLVPDGDVLFATANKASNDPGGVFVFDSESGKELARVETPAFGIAIADGVAYTGWGDGVLRAYRWATFPGRDAVDVGAGKSINAGATLDLAAMTLTPDDLAGAGLKGYGVGFGQTSFLDDVIASTAEARGLSEDEVRQFYEDAGFVRRYDTYLYLPADPSNPNGGSTRLVVSYVLQFANESGAASAWEFLEDESSSETAEDVPGVETVADQSEATRDRGTDSATGKEYAELDFTFRVGNLHTGVAIIDWQGKDPDVAEAEDLANRQLDRIEATLDAGAPGLSNRVSRLTGSAVAPSADYYLIHGGEAITLYGESIQQTTARSDAAADVGQTDSYRLWQEIAAGTDSSEDDVWYLVELDRFADEDAASAWLVGTEQRLEANTALTNLKVDEDAPTFGEESIAYAIDASDGSYRYRSVALRVGSLVALIDVGAPQTPPAEAVATLAQAQAACLASDGCAEPLSIPEQLQFFIAGLGNAATPPTLVTPEPEVTPTVGTGGTKTYTSPTYGYTLTYDPAIWPVANEYVGSYDSLTLQSQSATVVLSGTNVYDDLAGCLAGTIEGFQLGEGTPAEGITGPTPAAGAESALMTYEVTTQDGTIANLVAYFECRWVVEGESTLTITLLAAADAFPAALPLYEDLIAGLTIPAIDNRGDTTGTEPYAGPTSGYSVRRNPADWSSMSWDGNVAPIDPEFPARLG